MFVFRRQTSQYHSDELWPLNMPLRPPRPVPLTRTRQPTFIIVYYYDDDDDVGPHPRPRQSLELLHCVITHAAGSNASVCGLRRQCSNIAAICAHLTALHTHTDVCTLLLQYRYGNQVDRKTRTPDIYYAVDDATTSSVALVVSRTKEAR